MAAITCQLLTEKPVRRNLHIRNFRYGKEPAVIRCNRGDTLALTFSSDDTGHSFFLEEFDTDAKVSPGDSKVKVFKTSDPTATPFVTDTVFIIARQPGIRNYLLSKYYFRCHVWCGPLHAFEQGKIIIMPNTLLFFSLGCLVAIISLWFIGVSRYQPDVFHTANSFTGIDALERFPLLKKLVVSRWPQIILALLAFILIYIVIITAIFGTKVSGRNLGVMLMWTVWLFFLIVVLTPLGGRIWCTICPLPVLGDWLQRGSFFLPGKGKTGEFNNIFRGLFLRWPRKLDNNWLKLMIFLVLATFSTTLVASPRISGITVLALLVVPTVMSMIWELRSFCRYLCPVSLFVGPFSALSPVALRNRSQSVCSQCRSKSCEKGNTRGWACPYGLNAANLDENSDCGLCLECLRSCSYDNVSIFTKPFGTLSNPASWSQGWMIIAVFVISIIYSILYLGPWPWLRDIVDILDKKNWGLFSYYSTFLWLTVLAFVPGYLYCMSRLSRRLTENQFTTKQIFLKSTGTLLPLGLFLWIAFVIPMLFVNITFIRQSFSDPFGWGWNLFNQANTPWHQFVPGLIPWLQAILVLVGFSLSMRNLFRVWKDLRPGPKQLLFMSLPAGSLITATAVFMLIFFTN